MASSYLSENEAPRDFRISGTESDGHYTKCVLCYTVKRNFYCADCVRTGNFVHSSMPYSDRFSEKQAKLLRLKANRKHVLERCEKLLAGKIKKDTLLIEANQSKDKLDLIRLAIEQRRKNVEEKIKELRDLTNFNNDLRLKLPRYQKRVASLGKHVQGQRMELRNKISLYSDQAASLAALRRSRIRQLTKYIFPVYISYDNSDSIEDMEFVGDDIEEEPVKKMALHIVEPWIHVDGDHSTIHTLVRQKPESGGGWLSPRSDAARRSAAALALAAQLVALLAWALHVRLPHSLPLSEYTELQVSGRRSLARVRAVCAGAAALCARASLPPLAPQHALTHIHALARAAAADEPALGRVEGWMSSTLAEEWAACDSWLSGEESEHEDEPPEHLHWPETMEMEEGSAGSAGSAASGGPPPSLVTSAAASIASMWRGWTK